MVSWSLKRRMVYMGTTFMVVAILLAWWLFVTFYQPPSCFDGKQNNLEAGIDCGGECQFLCPYQVAEPVVIFSRSFEVTPGVYNAVAYVENPNADAESVTIGYTFKLYDKQNNFITERTGQTFIPAGKLSPIFEGSIVTGNRVPVRTVFEFTGEEKWTRTQDTSVPPFIIKDKTLENADTLPRVSATLENTSAEEFRNVEVIVVVFNALKNAIATSRTFIDYLPRKGSIPLVFTWPQPLAHQLEACSVPIDVMLLLDTSGSMNDDQNDPPQPLTDAKAAAADFVGRLSELDRAGIITFATQSTILSPFSTNHDTTADLIQNISILPAEEVGSTNMGDALRDSVNILADDTSATEGAKKAIILLTDGIANEPEDPGGEPYALEYANTAKENGYTIYTIGLGEKVNDSFLRDLASAETSTEDTFYHQAATSKDLSRIYKEISESLCERGPAVIEITPRVEDKNQ